jgi:hypothetical protein
MGLGRPCFPQAGHGKNREVVETAIRSDGVPRSLSRSPGGVLLRAEVDRVILALPPDELAHSWVMMTAYPVCGDGVFRNIAGRRGRREPVPLNSDELFRTIGL